MLCNAILTYILVFKDGRKETHEKWLTQQTAIALVYLVQHRPEDIAEDLDYVQETHLTVGPAFDCSTGPKFR